MKVHYYSSLRAKFWGNLLISSKIYAILLVISQVVFGSSQQYTGKQTLETISRMVARNEDLASLIKMNYEVTYSRTGQSEVSQKGQSSSGRHVSRQFTHYKSVWAQEGIKQYFNVDYYYSPDESESYSSTQIVDGELMKQVWGKKSDIMSGKIDYIETFRWSDIKPSAIVFRPFEGKYLLSKILVQEFASIHDKTEMLEGRETYVIDVKRPESPIYFGKVWVDCERGIPLRFEYYDKDPALGQARLIRLIDSIKPHQLPNGGWITVKGVMTYFFYPSREDSMHISVDVNSVTIRKEDIPNSLFELEFPEGATIYNAITGITTKAGRVEDMKLEGIIDESIEEFGLDASPAKIPSSEQTKQKAVDLSPNETITSMNEDTSKILVDVHPGDTGGLSIVWIFLPAFLAAFALTIIALIFRSSFGTMVRRNVK